MASSDLTVLLVEDNPGEGLLVRELLSQARIESARVFVAASLQQALEGLGRAAIDVILLDLTLPDSSGIGTVERMQASASALPIIVLTGMEDEDLALSALRRGAQDYLVKGQFDGGGLLRAIRYAIDRKRAEEDLRRARDELEVRVRERTADLLRTVESLQEEVLRRTRAESLLKARGEQLRALASELTTAEQRERRRLAQVLHDHLQQLLVGAKFRIRPLERTGDEDSRRAARDVDDLLTQCVEASRSLTAELSPPILHEGGLVPALEWLGEWMSAKHGLRVELEVLELAEPLSEDVTILLFQAVRELLFNVVKHSGVKQARVEVGRDGGRLKLVVSDEGAGFDPASVRAGGGAVGGFGLFSIRERMEFMGCRVEMESGSGRGSRFTLLAPLGIRAE